MRTVVLGLVTVTMALAGLTLVGCGNGTVQPAAAKLPEVQVSEPVLQSIVDFEEFTGRTEAKEAVEVKARVTGDIVKVNFQDGAAVQKGDVLFEIEPKQYLAELQRADATLNQAQVRLKRLDSDFQRAATLVLSRSISQEEFDKIRGDRMEADAAVGVAQANVVLAKQNFDYTKVTARSGGRASRRFIDAGNLAEKDKTVLTTIVSTDPMYVYFDVDERTVLRLRALIREGAANTLTTFFGPPPWEPVRALIQKGKIKTMQDMIFEFGLANEEGCPHKGKIDFEDNKIDSGTGTLRLRGQFDNSSRIAPGLFVRLRLFLGEERQALLISESALVSDQGQKNVYVVNKENKAEYRALQREDIGALIGGLRVIERGIMPGELVIVRGLQRVRPNAPVDVKVVPMPGVPAKVEIDPGAKLRGANPSGGR